MTTAAATDWCLSVRSAARLADIVGRISVQSQESDCSVATSHRQINIKTNSWVVGRSAVIIGDDDI